VATKGIIISIIILVISIPLAMMSVSNLIENEEERQRSIEQAKPSFIDAFEATLELCENSKGMETEGDIMKMDICRQQLQFNLERCSRYGNPPICNDPRIKEFLN